MYLLYGVLFLSIAVLSFAVLMIGCRNPLRPAWAGEGIVSNIYLPLVIGALVMGFIYVLESVFMYTPGIMEIGYVVMVLAMAVGIYKMLNVRKRLAIYNGQNMGGVVLKVDFQNANQENQPRPPVHPSVGYRKAA